MSIIKMKKEEYKDCNAIYDVMNYCLNHDLIDYNVMYLPVRNDYMMCAAEDRTKEVRYMADFWNAILDVHNKNCGKRFNHYIIGIGYENQPNVHYYETMIPCILLEYLQDKGFPCLLANHVTLEGYHHIHIMVGVTNIYGESAYMQGVNTWTIAIYLNTNIPGLKIQVVADD